MSWGEKEDILMDHKSATPRALDVEISISPDVSAVADSFIKTVCAMVHTAGLDARNPDVTSLPVVRFDAIPTYDQPVQDPEDRYCR